ncbi:(2Fe-2S)-binding protein [Pelagivirga sediminicola]|uniref:(2Fe-2S)-binding protein n=1 Tax=Pelagivirga sediminicola TaxID=2170575 RepID=A0A2T7G559_9RHOB|nr:(2Fe-2S)-binding protein [Pelagivirga sediminicola]PVA09563.1 (2Fe-2S)-binding protein [Pelagivirga sediminicola]
MTIRLTINGQIRTYDGDPRDSLLDALRRTYRLTGAKDVCREGFCGACTVHIDGQAVPSCLRPMGLLEGADVTTIEGISSPEGFSPVQAAFVEHDVVQCGMCFPGMVMSMTDFLKRNPSPSRAEVKTAMAGNLCRCTGYEKIVDAVMSVQADERANR